MERLLKWISEHKKTTLFCGLLLVFLPIIVIHILFKIKTGVWWIQAEWEAGEILGYFGDVLSFVGSVVLGYIAISQTEKANTLNEELLNIEKNKIKPCVDIDSSQLHKIYLAEDMYKQFWEKDRTDRMVIEVLYKQNPRSGIVADSALVRLEILNSGGSDIRRIYIQSAEFYLCVNDPNNNTNGKIARIFGNTNLKIGEKRTLYIYVKREISDDKELYDDWYAQHSNELMPHMEFELVLETISGNRYLEKIVCGSGWDASMQNVGNTVIREIGVLQMNVIELHNKSEKM